MHESISSTQKLRGDPMSALVCLICLRHEPEVVHTFDGMTGPGWYCVACVTTVAPAALAHSQGDLPASQAFPQAWPEDRTLVLDGEEYWLAPTSHRPAEPQPRPARGRATSRIALRRPTKVPAHLPEGLKLFRARAINRLSGQCPLLASCLPSVLTAEVLSAMSAEFLDAIEHGQLRRDRRVPSDVPSPKSGAGGQ